jgi:hypothetical protein
VAWASARKPNLARLKVSGSRLGSRVIAKARAQPVRKLPKVVPHFGVPSLDHTTLDLPCAAPLVGNVRPSRYLFTEVNPPLVGEGNQNTFNIFTNQNNTYPPSQTTQYHDVFAMPFMSLIGLPRYAVMYGCINYRAALTK